MKTRIPLAVACAVAGSLATLLVTSTVAPRLHPAYGSEGCAAAPCSNGDVNGDGSIDVSDAVYLLSYLYTGGPPPIEIAPSDPPSEPLVGSASGCPLPATGQAACYALAWPAGSCEDPEFPGQDGFHRAGCPAEGRFVDHGDGTVTDTCTGLMWQKGSAPERYTWQQALRYCEGASLGGHSDWRLPNVRELQSLADYGRDHPAIDPVFEAAMSWYWSSSTLAVTPAEAWTVCFGYGGAVREFEKTGAFHVRSVRGG